MKIMSICETFTGEQKSNNAITFSLLLHLVFMRLAELSPGISNVGVALAGQRVGIPISHYVRVAWFQQARLQVAELVWWSRETVREAHMLGWGFQRISRVFQRYDIGNQT